MENTTQNQVIKRSRRPLIVVAIVISVLVAGVVTTLAMKRAQTITTQGAMTVDGETQKTSQTSDKYVTTNGAGQIVVLNRQTGETRGLTPEEAQRLADGIKQLLNQDTTGLVQVHHKNGTVSMDLQGRFQNVVLAKREADGTITQGCVDNPGDAAAFFDIDPALVGAAQRAKTQPTSNTLPIR